ncbi:MAG: hypothetical protein WBA74_01395 [Cyclobacteriaceae bacterium]
MKKFLIKFSIITVPVLLAAVIIEVMLRNMPNDYLIKKGYLDKKAIDTETLIFGSSHAFYGLNPEFFNSNTFNASNVSQSLKYDLALLKKYEDELKNLETVILPISYFTLYWDLDSSPESWRLKNYQLYFDLETDKPIINSSEVLSNRFSSNIRRLFSYYILRKPSTYSTERGWGTKYTSTSAKDLEKTAKSALARHTREDIQSKESVRIFDENVAYMNSLVKWSNERGVRILFLIPPVYESYYNNLDGTQLAKTLEAIEAVSLGCKDCKFLNLIDDPNFERTDYYDADHLSEIGAKKLSLQIDRAISNWR